MKTILQKFFIIAVTCHVCKAAPGDLSESPTTTDFNVPDTTTTMALVSTTDFDTRQNEVDAKFANAEVDATESDINEKIESIENDDEKRSTETLNENVSTTQSSTTLLLLDELNESTTPKGEDEESASDEPTTISNKNVKEPEAVEEIREPNNNNKFERFATEAQQDESTTSSTKISHPDSTIFEAATEGDVQQKSADAEFSENETSTQSLQLLERTKALEPIRKVLKAHILRAIFTLLNQVKQRQQTLALEQQQQSVAESQVVEEILPPVSGSECDCGENEDVSTDDDGKVIAYDSASQKYVYMYLADYDTMLQSRQLHHVNS